MKILVIGAAGQLGFDLRRTFSPDHAVTCADTARAVAELPGTEGFLAIDITEPGSVDGVIASAAPDLVLNSAAFTNVDGCEANREACWAVNDTGASHVAKSCAAAGLPLIHISTDYVFDGSNTEPYREDDPVAPLGEYGKSKYAGEEKVRQALPQRHLIVRTAWLFGTHGHNFVKTMLRLGRERDQLSVVNDQTGGPTYAGHLAAALKSLAEQRLGDPGVYHMTGAGQCTWFDFTCEIFRLAGISVDVKPTTTAAYNAPASRPAYSVLANTRAPEIAMPYWRDGLIECLRQLGELNTDPGESSSKQGED